AGANGVSPGARTEPSGIDAVRVDDDLGARDAVGLDRVGERARDNDDAVGATLVDALEERGHPRAARRAPVLRQPDLRPVPFEQQREAREARDGDPGPGVPAVALVEQVGAPAPDFAPDLARVDEVVPELEGQ